MRKSQRDRLFAAMVASVAERGYEATSIADLITVSGVSRTSFYEHFSDKQDCFVATLRTLLDGTAGITAQNYDGHGAALKMLIERIVAQPAAARMCFVESYAAGPPAIELMDHAVKGIEVLYEQTFAARSGEPEMPPEIVQAIVGGLRRIIYTRLRRQSEEELLSLAPALWEWSFTYEAPPRSLRRRRRSASARAPGSRYQPDDSAERMIRAATAAIAKKGYPAATIADIAKRASASVNTFYANFDGKEDILEAALDAGHSQLFGVLLPAYRRGKDWPQAVRFALNALLAFFAAESDFARLTLVQIWAAGPRALDRRDNALREFERFLAPGYERSPQTVPIAAEAITGAISTLMYNQLQAAGPESLPQLAPEATYIVLAPFLGAEEACAVANG